MKNLVTLTFMLALIATSSSIYANDEDVNYQASCVEAAKAFAVKDYNTYDSSGPHCGVSPNYMTVYFSKRLSMGMSTQPLRDVKSGRLILGVYLGGGGAGSYCPSNLEYFYYYEIDARGNCRVSE